MAWIDKIKEFFIGEEQNKITVEHWVAEFTTIDGKVHHDYHFPFVAPEKLVSYTVPRYLMIGEKYLEDSDNTIYPIENVISIKWYRDATKDVLEKNLCLAYYYD